MKTKGYAKFWGAYKVYYGRYANEKKLEIFPHSARSHWFGLSHQAFLSNYGGVGQVQDWMFTDIYRMNIVTHYRMNISKIIEWMLWYIFEKIS